MQCRVIYFPDRKSAERRAREINNGLVARATGNKATVQWDGEDGYMVVQPIGC